MIAFSLLNMDFSERLKLRMRELGVTAADIAQGVGVSKGAVTHWTNGTNQASGKRLISLASVLRCDPAWLASGDGSMLRKKTEAAPGAPSEKDYALIPQYTAKGAAGNGHLNDHVEVKGGLAFKRDWLTRLGVKEHRCSVIYAEGSSMEPSIGDGEVVLIDHDDTEPRDGKVYVMLRPDGEIIIKRLTRQMSGWVIRSDNEDKRRYPDEPISQESLQHIELVGRVVWRGGGL